MAIKIEFRNFIFFHGYGKFPLPPQKLIDYFGFSENLASFVALSELSAGVLLILGGFIKSYMGDLTTRFGEILWSSCSSSNSISPTFYSCVTVRQDA